MPQSSEQNAFEPDRYRDAEAQLGGADAVPKTTYVTGEGTAPERRRSEGPAARVRSGAPHTLWMIVLALVALVSIVYLVGLAG